MNVVLINYTPAPDHTVALAARQCYDSDFVGNKIDAHSRLSDEKLIQKILDNGHTSVLEHASFTFAIEGISRACSHQLVRFRHASFSQQSQRYVTFKDNFLYVTPPSIKGSTVAREYFEAMEQLAVLYDALIAEGIPAEDARFILPNATETKIVMTMNARELLHAFSLRCCSHAQWEIRDTFNEIKRLVKEVAPITFAKAGPSCETKGRCSEGSRCCGKIHKWFKQSC